MTSSELKIVGPYEKKQPDIDYAKALAEASRLKYFGHLNRLGNTGLRAANLQSRVVLPGTAIKQLIDRVALQGRRLGIDLATEERSIAPGQKTLTDSRVQILEIPEGSPQTLHFEDGTAAALTPIAGSLEVRAPQWDIPIRIVGGESVYIGPSDPALEVTADYGNTTALLLGGRELAS